MDGSRCSRCCGWWRRGTVVREIVQGEDRGASEGEREMARSLRTEVDEDRGRWLTDVGRVTLVR